MTKYLWIFSLLTILNFCSEQQIEPDSYNISVKNNYFEAIDSVILGGFYIGKIKTDTISNFFSLDKGSYNFLCTTESFLKISAKINVQGVKKHIIIELNEKGKVEVE